MAFRTNDFLKEASTTTGTGNITLTGARTPGSTFASAISNGDTFHYAISHDTLNEWETGLGTMLTSTTFSRSVISSSNANALVNFSGGSKRVDVVLPASRIVSLAGPLFFNGVSASSGNLSFDNAGGVSFGIAGNVVTAAAPAFTGLTTNNAFQLISLATYPGAFSASVTDGTVATISATRLVFPAAVTSNSSALSQANVAFFASGSSLAAAAFFGAVASTNLGHHVQNISFSNANGMTFLGTTTTGPGGIFAGAMAVLSVSYRALRSVALFSPNIVSMTTATESTANFPQRLNLPLLGTAFNTSISYINVGFRLVTDPASVTDTLVAAAWARYFAGNSAAGITAQQLSLSDLNGVTFGIFSTTFAGIGVIPVYTASFQPQIGLISHVGGQSVSNVTRLAFSDASNVTWSLSTAASAATVFASVAAGGGGGITAFALSNAASSVMATGLTFSNANGFSFLLSTAAGNAATLSGSYTVPAVVNSGLFQLTNSVSSVNASQVLLSAANGFSFLLSTAASGATLSGSYTVPTVPNLLVSHIGGNVASSVTQLAFSNASNVTFSLSTAANAATVIASVAAAGGLTLSGFYPYEGGIIVENQYGQNSVAVAPVLFQNCQFDRFAMPLALGTSNTSIASTGTLSITFRLGLYTRNVSTLSLLHSISNTFSILVNGAANSASYSGLRMTTIPWTTTVTGGQYWYGVVSSTTFSSANIPVRNGMMSQSIASFLGLMGATPNISQQLLLGNGIYSVTSGNLPGSIAFNQLNLVNTNSTAVSASSIAFRPPGVFFFSGTA